MPTASSLLSPVPPAVAGHFRRDLCALPPALWAPSEPSCLQTEPQSCMQPGVPFTVFSPLHTQPGCSPSPRTEDAPPCPASVWQSPEEGATEPGPRARLPHQASGLPTPRPQGLRLAHPPRRRPLGAPGFLRALGRPSLQHAGCSQALPVPPCPEPMQGPRLALPLTVSQSNPLPHSGLLYFPSHQVSPHKPPALPVIDPSTPLKPTASLTPLAPGLIPLPTVVLHALIHPTCPS